MTLNRWYVFGHFLFWLVGLAVFVLFVVYAPYRAPAVAAQVEPMATAKPTPAVAAQVEPMATAKPTPAPSCEHVATAGTIKIFYCEDIYLFINDLGFMAFEP